MSLDIADFNRNGQVFEASNQAGATVTLINTTTATGFILSNPFGSGKKLILLKWQFGYTTVPTATAVVFLATSVAPSPIAHATVTDLDVYVNDQSAIRGNAVAHAYNASVLPNLPRYNMQLGYSPTTPATAALGTFSANIQPGEIILSPGTFAMTSYITTAPVGITSAVWIEVPA